MPCMPRAQPFLHEAMRMILLDCPEHTATIEVLSEQNAQRDLYRQEDGDGKHPEPFQFELRARDRVDWFELVPPNEVKYIGPR